MIQVLDCTLRDGAYVVESQFGVAAIRGIIYKMQEANIDIIECGWLKNKPYELGSTDYHVPSDLEQYIITKDPTKTYVAMIDWDRYDLSLLPEYDGRSIDAIRVVFPYKHFREGIALGEIIKAKGYEVYFQAANTLEYSREDLLQLVELINIAKPTALSIVDTFGAMYEEDLAAIISVMDEHLDKEIGIGFHSHNNQQLSFALSQYFIKTLERRGRNIVIDSSLCGMGRGAGNTTTELIVSYLNRKYNGGYDINVVLDAIDTYMEYFKAHYTWGYSTPYFISGMYCAHVNNIAYLKNTHLANALVTKSVISALSDEDRRRYDYDLLEQKYIEYSNCVVDDTETIATLKAAVNNRKVLLLSPGASVYRQKDRIKEFCEKNNPLIISVNALIDVVGADYAFFCNRLRYDYAKEAYTERFYSVKKILTSNVKTLSEVDENVINFNLLVKRGWEHFDNATIMCLRLLKKLHAKDVVIAGFDGFEDNAENYFDVTLPKIDPGKSYAELNAEIQDMFDDFYKSAAKTMSICFLTESKYNRENYS